MRTSLNETLGLHDDHLARTTQEVTGSCRALSRVTGLSRNPPIHGTTEGDPRRLLMEGQNLPMNNALQNFPLNVTQSQDLTAKLQEI